MSPSRRRLHLALASLLAIAALPSVAVAQPASGGLRTMTFNIQSGSRGLEGVARVIRSHAPDLVALQEVDRFSRRSGGKDQAEALAKLTGMPYHAHFRATRLFGGDYGVALLSRFPLEDLWNRPLPRDGSEEARTVGRARIRVGGQLVSVYVTHLAHMPNKGGLRARQMRAIVEALEADPYPKLVMGDLNDGAGSEAVRVLKAELRDAFDAAGKGSSGTYPLPLFLPTLRLDYVMASEELEPQESFVVRSDASDHYPVVAEFQLRGSEAPQVARAAGE